MGEEGSPSADVNKQLAIEVPLVPAVDHVRNRDGGALVLVAISPRSTALSALRRPKLTFWNQIMWIQRFRTSMEPAIRTGVEELSGLSGHMQTVLRTLVCDLIGLGTDWSREMTIVASISASKRPSGHSFWLGGDLRVSASAST